MLGGNGADRAVLARLRRVHMSVTGLDSSQEDRAHRRLVARAMDHRLARSMKGEGLKAKALRGAGWTLVGFAAKKPLGLVSTLVLTRLLFPEVFGLMALAGVFMTGLQMFSDIGIRPSIIQNKRGDDPDFLNTAWTIQIIRGFVLWLIACLIAYPVSVVYGEPLLFPILCAIGSTAAIRGFQTTGYATANRKLLLGKLTMVELITHAIAIAVTIAWAWVHPTVWALVGGGVISSLVSVSLGFRVLNTHQHRIRWDQDAARELFRFGKWIFISTAITFLSNSGDKVFLPKILSIVDLSFYALAMALLAIPTSIIKKMATQVLFPVYVQIFHKSGEQKINRVTYKFFTYSIPIYLIPIAFIFLGEPVISLMYDDRYRHAGPALSILAIGGYMTMMRASQNGLLLAAGDSKRAMLASASRIATGLPLGAVLAVPFGLPGFCAGMVVSDSIALLVQRKLARTRIPKLNSAPDQILLAILLLAVAIRAMTV
ncbi:MAG: oligosaccharide flippase family protein [Phycisphaerales bacterium]|nr:oligosaccharide flippase family protein [Phycisphaerales bacterium]